MNERVFDAEILAGRGGGAGVEIPFDVKEAFGSGRPRIKAAIDGHIYRGSLASMGGRHILGITKDVRAAIGKDIGDTVHVTVALDLEGRVVDVPAELQDTLGRNPEAMRLFDTLSYTHRKEYARWVAKAKKQETRDRRAAKAVEMLLKGERL
jgi:hypothetical protein